MTEIWQVTTRDAAPEWFDTKPEALARVSELVDAGKVPVCVPVPLWDRECDRWTRGPEDAANALTGQPDTSGAMFGDRDDEQMGRIA